ncbi:MAG: hypothetical protein JNL52_04230 [Flavobacteriales bacterium]|nr:hypothetical protein [Flavobacteriales bacterium]
MHVSFTYLNLTAMVRFIPQFVVCLLAYTASAQQSTGLLWERTLGGNQTDIGRKLARTADGGLVVVGGSASVSATSSATMGDLDVWVVRLDANGAPLWHRNFGGSGHDLALYVDVHDDGRITVIGRTASPNGDLGAPLPNADYFLLTLNADGDPLIAQRFSAGPSEQTDLATCVRLDDGSYAAIGSKLVYPSAGPVNVDVMVLRLTATGTVLWVETFGGFGYDSGIGINTSPGGKIIASCSTRSSNGDVTGYMGLGDGWLLEVSTSGELISQRTLGGAFDDQISDALQTSEGHFVVTGYYSYEMMSFGSLQPSTRVVIEKLTPNGQSIWRHDLGGTNGDYGWHIRQAPDGGYLLFAYAYSNDGDVTGFAGTIDAWLVRLDEQGELLWQRTFGGFEEESVGDIALTADGGCVLLMVASGPNAEMSQYFGGIDTWVVRLGPELSTATAPQADDQEGVRITQVPGGFAVQVDTRTGPAQCLVRDVAGRLLHSSTLAPGLHTLPLPSHAGIYMIGVQAGGRTTTARVVQQ